MSVCAMVKNETVNDLEIEEYRPKVAFVFTSIIMGFA